MMIGQAAAAVGIALPPRIALHSAENVEKAHVRLAVFRYSIAARGEMR
jgi:hypothetical protein